MRRTGYSLAILAVAFSLSLCSAEKTREIRLYHFNDFHGQVAPLQGKDGAETAGLARLAGLWQLQKEEARTAGAAPLLVFSGDVFTGTAFSTLFQGEPEFAALSQMGLTAMTTGNHEWDFGAGVLTARARGARFPLLLTNVESLDPSHAFWKPSLTVETEGMRIGILGVTTQDTPVTTAPGNTQGFRFTDPVEAVARVLQAQKGTWDAVILLSHCGFEVDRAIARRCPGITVIVGGHDHKVLEAPSFENGVAIVQAGDRGRFLGEVKLRFITGQRPSVEGRLLPVDSRATVSAPVAALLRPWMEREEKALGAPLATLPVALEGDRQLLRTSEAPLGNFVADAMRAHTGAEVALVNAGALRAGLPAGEVTGRDLYACVPFFDSVGTVVLKGSQVQSILNRCAALPVVDPSGGFLQVSGIQAIYTDGKATAISVGGKPLEPEREYTVACTHFLMGGGDGHTEFSAGRDSKDYGVSLQELVRRALVAPGLKLPGIERRIVRIHRDSD